MENLIFLIIFELILFFSAFYFSQQDIMAPSCMFCIMFLLSTTIALFNIDNWNSLFNIETGALIASGMFVFVAGEIGFRYVFCNQLRGKSSAMNEERDEVSIYIKPWILTLIIIFNIIVIYLYFRNIMSTVGGNLTDIYSYFHAYRVLGIQNLQDEGTSITPGPITFLLRFTVAFGYMAAYMFMRNRVQHEYKKIDQIKYLFIIILSVLPSMMSGGRSGVLKILSAMAIFYYICWHQKNGWRKNLSWNYIGKGVIAFFVLVPAFYFSLALLGRQTETNLIDYVSNYLAGSIFLLNQYLEDPVISTYWGEESLAGVRKIFSFLGIGAPSASYNLEFRSLGIVTGNVYTFFRRPLHDFGLLGMYIFVILIAFFFAYLYYKKIKYQPRKECMGYVLTYGYLYYWIIISAIDQYSMNYIAVGTVIQIAIAVLALKIFTREEQIRANSYTNFIKHI